MASEEELLVHAADTPWQCWRCGQTLGRENGRSLWLSPAFLVQERVRGQCQRCQAWQTWVPAARDERWDGRVKNLG